MNEGEPHWVWVVPLTFRCLPAWKRPELHWGRAAGWWDLWSDGQSAKVVSICDGISRQSVNVTWDLLDYWYPFRPSLAPFPFDRQHIGEVLRCFQHRPPGPGKLQILIYPFCCYKFYIFALRMLERYLLPSRLFMDAGYSVVADSLWVVSQRRNKWLAWWSKIQGGMKYQKHAREGSDELKVGKIKKALLFFGVIGGFGSLSITVVFVKSKRSLVKGRASDATMFTSCALSCR